MDDDLILELDNADEVILEQDNADEETLESDTPYYSQTADYERLENKPQINSVNLVGNKSAHDLGLQDELQMITRAEIREIINQL